MALWRRRGARRIGGNGQWPSFVDLEVLDHGFRGEVVPERWGTDQAQVGIEGNEALVEGAVVEGVEGDAVLGVEAVLGGNVSFQQIWFSPNSCL